MTRPARAQAGVTLVELMISLGIASVGVTASFGVGMAIMGGYRDHRRMSSVERAARSSMEIVARAARGASAGAPTGDVVDLVGCGGAGSVRVTNGGDGPDTLAVIHASGGVLTSLRATYDGDSPVMVVGDGSELRPGDHVIVTDSERGHLVRVTDVHIAGGAWLVAAPPPAAACPGADFPPAGYPPGSYVIRAALSQFFIDDTDLVGGVPTLMLDPDGEGPLPPEPLAPGVEDLQIAVGVDMDGDGAVTDGGTVDDEWFYNTAGDADPPPLTKRPPRAYRITIAARSVGESGTLRQSTRPAIEDRPAADEPDVYRRRILSATVEIRNLEGSP